MNRHAQLAPVFIVNDLASMETDAQMDYVTVRRGGAAVYSATGITPRVDLPVKGLWSWDGHWVLEFDGQTVVDGASLNQQLCYDKIFGWRLLSRRGLALRRD